MSGPRVITEELGGSALARAAQRLELPQWYVARPTSPNAWRAYLRDVASKHATRDWYEPLAPAIAASGEAAARVRRVVDSGGVVISTGQQAALFGGPLYTLIKAIGALGFADALERATGVATVVVFWAATDDADYDEASWTSVAVAGGLRTLRLPPAPRADAPMSDMPMPGVERLVAELAQACGSVSNVEALDSVREIYTSRITLGAAYVQQLRALLEPLGIAVLDASQGVVRRAAAPVLSRALMAAAPLESALRERYQAIAGARFTPQVEHLPGLSLVFATEGGGGKRRLPVTEAANVLDRYPIETLSPNVLLRPIVERFIMPSAAYLAGPGELAYFAQVHAAADALAMPQPLPVPRWSATILEPRIERLLEKLGIRSDDVRNHHAVESRLARGALPEDVAGSLQKLRQDLEADVAALEVVDRDNLVPPASLQGLRRSLLHRLERMERRYLAAMKRRESALMRDIATAAASLYPNGMRQERVLNFVPFLARYGTPLLVQLRSEATQHAMTLVGASTEMSATVAERV